MIKKITLSTLAIAILAVSVNAKTSKKYVYAKAYSQAYMNKVEKKLDKALKKIDELEASNNESIDELYERVDENEFYATMNRIKWGAEFEVSTSFIDGETGSMKIPGMSIPSTDYSRNNQWTTKLRLSMDAKINDKTKFTGRLSMFKNWSDSTPNTLTDPAQGRKPVGGGAIYVERAYVDYAPISSLIFTIGRQPSSDGPGMTLVENTKRKSTYPALLFDGAADGIVVTSKLAPSSAMNPTFRVAYGKGYQDTTNYSAYTPNQNEIEDLNVYGAFYEMSLPFESMGNNLLVLSYVNAKDFVGHPQYTSAPNNQNLGDMTLAGIYFENNKAFGTNLSYFISAGFNMPDSNGKTVNFGAMTGNQDVALLAENGHAFQIGARYDIGSIKVGYEFNKGSRYWYSFTNGSSDLLNKLATRGSVNDIYAIYQLDIYQFIKLGYTMIDYEYTGSGWHIGTPMETDDYVNRAYATYNLRF